MKPLIPYIILENFEKGQNYGNFEAFTLFIDLSGFTPMTEKLLLRGNKGAEQLSILLNNIFEPLVETVYNHGGFIPYFAGDAFHAIFPFGIIEAVGTLTIAQEFISKFAGQRFSDEFEIRCKIGLSCGNVEWGIVGGNLKSYYFRGPAIMRSADCQLKASAQQIIFDDFFRTKLSEPIVTEKKGKDYYLVLNNLSKNENKLPLLKKVVYGAENLRHFFPQAVLEFNQSGEFREIVTVFISFQGVETHAALNTFATLVLDQVQNFSGYFKEIDFGDKGGVMLAFFGAPLTYENNIQRALGFALSVAEEAELLSDISVGFGVSSGLAYTGIIGGKQRCQYAAVGSRVNLAARLMTEAGNKQIFTDEETSRVKGYSFSYHGNISYKGISKDIPTYLLLGRKNEDDITYAGPIVGRMEELSLLQKFAQPILENNFAGIAVIFGEPGIGKSRLCYELKNVLSQAREIEYIVCQSDQILKKPFNPLIYALKNSFGQSGDKTVKENSVVFEKHFEQLLNQLLESDDPKADTVIRELLRTKSILAGLAGIVVEDSLWSQLDAKGRHENTIIALQNFFYSRALLNPVIMEIEDWHWTDSETVAMLPDFILKLRQFPVLLIITSRYQDDGSKPTIFSTAYYDNNRLNHIEVDLNILKAEAIRNMAEMRLGDQIDVAFLDFLQRSCNGNPFYIEQLLEYFTESSLLEKSEGYWTIKDKSMKIGGSINAVLMARVDRLSYLVKETVKAAAVIGREFEIPVLSEIMSKQEDFLKRNGNQHLLLKEQVQTAEKSQIWWAINEIRYIFKHSLLREAVYEMQLSTRLRDLHRLIAEAIEHIYQDSLEERFADLAFHYEQADIKDLTVKYLEKAADYACRNYQNVQALAYFEKLNLIYRDNSQSKQLIKILLKKGKIEQLMGAWDESQNSFSEALSLSLKMSEELLSGRSNNALGSLLMMKGSYTDAKRYFEEALTILEKQQDQIGISKSFAGLANLYFRLGNYESAKSYFLQSMNIIKNIDESMISPQNIATLGLTYMNLNSYDEGILSIQQYLPLAESRNDKQGLASLHTNLGIIYYEKGDYDAALFHYLDGLALSEELGNKLLESIALGCIGSVYENKGDFAKAKIYFEEDLHLTKSLGDRQGMAIAYGLLGSHFALIGEFDTALAYLEPNLKLCEELGYQKGIIKSLNTLGEISFYKGNFSEAIDCYQKSIAVAKKINNKLLQGMSMIDLCNVYIENNEWQKALELQNEIENHLSVVTKRSFHFGFMMLSASLCIFKRENGKAEEILQHALQQNHLSAEEEAAVYYQFSAVHADSSSWKQKVLKQYQALFDLTPKYVYLYRINKLQA